MGSGEPLDNYDNVLKFLRLINDPNGQNMGQRHITLRLRLGGKNLCAGGGKSSDYTGGFLHAPNDEIRTQTMPVAKLYDMDRLCRRAGITRRKQNAALPLKYALIHGVNDGDAHARELAGS